jgi:hypothetical protein
MSSDIFYQLSCCVLSGLFIIIINALNKESDIPMGIQGGLCCVQQILDNVLLVALSLKVDDTVKQCVFLQLLGVLTQQ